MRCTQPIGLNEWAQTLVKGKEVVLYEEIGFRQYPSGRTEKFQREHKGSDVKTKETGQYVHGMFCDDTHSDCLPLHTFKMPDGTIYEEFEQASPRWSSGPMLFTALRKDGKKLTHSLWTEEEMSRF